MEAHSPQARYHPGVISLPVSLSRSEQSGMTWDKQMNPRLLAIQQRRAAAGSSGGTCLTAGCCRSLHFRKAVRKSKVLAESWVR